MAGIAFAVALAALVLVVVVQRDDARHSSGRRSSAPDITYGNLTDSQGMVTPDGTRAETFTDADIRNAVVDGIDPGGGRLATPMPQWQLTDEEWSALLAYLRTLP